MRISLFLLNPKGFSTVELIISLSFLGLLVYGGLSTLEKQKLQIIAANQEIEMTSLTYKIRELLSDSQACSASFKGYAPNLSDPETITQLQGFSASAYSASNTETRFDDQEIKNITNKDAPLGLKDYRLDDSEINVGPEDQSTNLVITFDKGSYFKGDQRFAQKNIKLYYQLDQNGLITKCALFPFSSKQNPWSYNSKEQALQLQNSGLGIGTNSPKAQLDIKGALLLQEIGQRSLCDESIKGTLQIYGPKKWPIYCDGRVWRPLAL